MTCPLCTVWEMMPYHKRWSTPTTPQECEGAMAAGFWAASIPELVEPLCERHQNIMVIFNKQHAERKRIQEEMRIRVSPEHSQQVQEFLQRAKDLATPPPPVKPAMPPAIVPVFSAAPPAPMPQPAAPAQPMQPPPPVAAMTATPPVVTRFPCPYCTKLIGNGEVHDCTPPAPEKTP
jgi:hypothetical protein